MYAIQSVDDLTMAFGGNALELMPSYNELPDEFKQRNFWSDLVSGWFSSGLQSLNLKPKDGVNSKQALRQIRTVLGSFEPQHEHKEAGVAFLLSEWFEEEGSSWETKAFKK